MTDKTQAVFQRMMASTDGDIHETLKAFMPWLLRENGGDAEQAQLDVQTLVNAALLAPEPEEGVILEDEETAGVDGASILQPTVLLTDASQIAVSLSSPTEAARIADEATRRRALIGWLVSGLDAVGGSPAEWHEQIARLVDVDAAQALRLALAIRGRYPLDPTLLADALACVRRLGRWAQGDKLAEQAAHLLEEHDGGDTSCLQTELAAYQQDRTLA